MEEATDSGSIRWLSHQRRGKGERTHQSSNSGNNPRIRRRMCPRHIISCMDCCRRNNNSTEVKRSYITEKSLAHDESLSCRLDRSRTHHPVPAINRHVKCGVHHWCSGLQKHGQVMDCGCETCGVALCLPCYKLFHETVDLVQMKDSLKKEFKQDWEGSEPTTT